MSRPARAAFALALAALLAACARRGPQPAPLDVRELCAFCRMPVSDARLAAQLVVPGEEPRFFDDIGCLRDYLAKQPPPEGSASWVADHASGRWIPRDSAVYVRSALATPMGSHLAAFADAAGAKSDRAVAGGSVLTPSEVFGARPGGGAR